MQKEEQSWSHSLGVTRGTGIAVAVPRATRARCWTWLLLRGPEQRISAENCPEIQTFPVFPLPCACSAALLPGGGCSSCAFHHPWQEAFHTDSHPWISHHCPSENLPGWRHTEPGKDEDLEQPSPRLLQPLQVLLFVGCRLNIKPLKTFPASEHQRKGRAGADWGVPLLCVQGNTDPAAASRLRLPEGQTTAEVMRRFRPKASAWSVFVLVCGTRACPSTSFGQPWTLFFANSSQDSPGAGTGSDPENRQEQTFVPTSQRSSTLPS